MSNKVNDKKFIRDQFDNIYNTALEITKAYNSEFIPLNLLWELLQKSKLKKNKELKGFDVSYNKTVDTLYLTSMNYCERYDLNKRLPMIIFKKFISIINENI